MSDEDKNVPWLEPANEDIAEAGFMENYRMAIIAVSIFVIVAFALIIWQVYSSGDTGPSGDVPLIKAEDGPLREKPSQPGGMEIPDRDKLVYNRMDGGEVDVEQAHLRPGPEVPMDKPVDQPGAAVSGQAPAVQAPVGQIPAAQPQAAPAPAASAPQAAPAASVASLDAKKEAAFRALSGDYLIQLGAFSDRAHALAAWTKIQQKFPADLGKLQPNIVTVDRGAKGVLYRLQAGKIADRAGADSLCKSLSAKSQPCIVVHR